mmetsp:Transcript_2852/g.9591  ORF Transcript_2852/g.9591 Transcript_2852/m.9591 type:complete len:395 (-) Transcript_2852:981-2165(-)
MHDLSHPVNDLNHICLQHFCEVREVPDVAEAEEGMHNHARAVRVKSDDAVPQATGDHARSCLPEAQLQKLGKAQQPLLDLAKVRVVAELEPERLHWLLGDGSDLVGDHVQGVDDLQKDVGGDRPGGPEENEGEEEGGKDTKVNVKLRLLLLVERDDEIFPDTQFAEARTELARLACSSFIDKRHSRNLQEHHRRPHLLVLPQERVQHRLKPHGSRILPRQVHKRVGEDRSVRVDVGHHVRKEIHLQPYEGDEGGYNQETPPHDPSVQGLVEREPGGAREAEERLTPPVTFLQRSRCMHPPCQLGPSLGNAPHPGDDEQPDILVAVLSDIVYSHRENLGDEEEEGEKVHKEEERISIPALKEPSIDTLKTEADQTCCRRAFRVGEAGQLPLRVDM